MVRSVYIESDRANARQPEKSEIFLACTADSQNCSIINDYSKVKEQVIMVIEYLQQIKDSYFEQKHALEKQLNLLEIQLKENTGMIKMLEETNDSCYEL